MDLQRDVGAWDEVVLLHHDAHQRNVLWHDGRVSGLVDWNEACVGPAEVDVAYASVDLVMTSSPAAARALVEAYRHRSGRELRRLGDWQALWVLVALRWAEVWATAFEAVGAPDLTAEALRRRLTSFGEELIDRR